MAAVLTRRARVDQPYPPDTPAGAPAPSPPLSREGLEDAACGPFATRGSRSTNAAADPGGSGSRPRRRGQRGVGAGIALGRRLWRSRRRDCERPFCCEPAAVPVEAASAEPALDSPPENAAFSTDRPVISISPDGRQVAFAATDADGTTQLWIRALDSLAPRVLPGTEYARGAFWSPDSRFLAFFADGKLRSDGHSAARSRRSRRSTLPFPSPLAGRGTKRT